MIIVPFIPSVPAYEFSLDIDGVSYTFDVRWNGRASAWYVDVLLSDGTAVARGIKIVLGAYLGRGRLHELFQLGVFVARDTSGDQRDATLDDLGTRVEVVYVPIDEAIGRLVGSWVS